MTVRELIEKLADLDQDRKIGVWDFGSGGVVEIGYITQYDLGYVIDPKWEDKIEEIESR